MASNPAPERAVPLGFSKAPMNKRQRKKHRIGEFQELGFELTFQTPEGWTDAQQAAFWAALIAQAESGGLSLGGSSGASWTLFATGAGHRASATAEQRDALVAWLASQPGVDALQAGPLEDAWVD